MSRLSSRSGRLIVSITGPSNAGKSQLAIEVAAPLGEAVACRVPTDFFLVPRWPGQTRAGHLAPPLAWDFGLLRQRLSAPLGTVETTPDFDFEGFTRVAKRGGKPFTIWPVMLVDAIAPFPSADLVVRIVCPADVRSRRMRERDARWGTDVSARADHLEATWEEVVREGSAPDLVVNGEAPLEDNAVLVTGAIARLV